MPDLDAIRARAELNLAVQEHGRYIREVEARAIVATLDGLEQERAALLAEIERLREALAHAQATIGLATTYIPAARFEEFVNRRAALAAQESAEE